MMMTMTAAIAQAALPDFAPLAAKCGPAVVNINTERTTRGAGPEEFFGEMFRNMPPGFDRFFEPFGGMPGRGQRAPRKQKSLGSGFIISADGYIVTNNHVVAGADVIRVTLDEAGGKGRNLTATLVGTDEDTDLALLKISSKEPLPYLAFGNSDELKVGEWLLAIGNPFGLDHSVTSGILSAKNRNIHSGPFDNFLQTDASINPGNSGGPLLNMAGEVIGINTAIIASGQGIGFAIPSNMASQIIEQLKSGKKVSRGWIGVAIQDVDETTAKALGLEHAMGALVGDVMPGQPAAQAGLEEGDIIVSVDGQKIEDSSALLRAIAAKKPKSSVELGVWRNGKTMTMNVVLGERQSSQNDGGSVSGESDDQALLGISVRSLSDNERRELKLRKKEGLLVVDVDGGKPAGEADIRPGDVITKVNGKSVASAEDLSRIIKDEGVKRGAVMLQIMRRGDVFFRPVRGIVQQHFDALGQAYGVSILTSPGESVLSVLDGTVVYADYSFDHGWVVHVQHEGNYLSIYQNNTRLLKKAGDIVHAGEAIALTGEADGAGKPFYFELWNNGHAIDPEDVIVF